MLEKISLDGGDDYLDIGHVIMSCVLHNGI